MANWAWPHTPSSNLARILLVGGPFDGEQAGFVPPDTAPPVQVVWSGWCPHGFDAWLYEWRGETTFDAGRTDALIFRPTGRRIGADEIPPAVATAADLWADAADLIQSITARPVRGGMRQGAQR
jgi:hypothetical protein